MEKSSEDTLNHDPKRNKDWSAGPKRYYDLLRSNDTFNKTDIVLKDYTEYRPKGALVYCDPPYAGTTRYSKSSFDNLKFWGIIRKWSVDNWVFISEYNAPDNFRCVISYYKHCGMAHNRRDIRTEKVFIHESRYQDYLRFIVKRRELPRA